MAEKKLKRHKKKKTHVSVSTKEVGMDGPDVAVATVTEENVHMARLRRRWRILKWIGTLVCLILLIMFLVSTRRAVMWDSSDRGREVGLLPGTVAYGWRPVGWRLAHESYPPAPGWSLASYTGWSKPSWRLVSHTGSSWCWLEVPLWMPFLIVALPTGFLWYRDRRRIPPGHCQKCGYNLTGNVSGACPECGEKV
jgi:hypothetical protein